MSQEIPEFLARTYNLVLIEAHQRRERYDLNLLSHGLICDFEPTPEQGERLKGLYEPVNLENTLFTFDQAISMDVQDKIRAQISEYILSYKLGGAFLRSLRKTPAKTHILSGITKAELEARLKNIISSPIALRSEDIAPLSDLIYEYLGVIDLSIVLNNELKVKLLSNFLDGGERIDGLSGDDLIRFVVLKYTGSTLLIKSQAVLRVISESEEELVNPQFYFDYAKEIAPCFNRLKPILLAVRKKSPQARKAINRISRLSKDMHVAVGMPRSRTFLTDMSRGHYQSGLPEDFTIYDWFRILNAIAVRQADLENEVFQIRNGKVWFQPREKDVSGDWLKTVERLVLEQIAEKLKHLRSETIKLPDNIRLGLPISEKQSIGALPFGTVISTQHFSKTISVGIYWENEWGARDLDLSVIDISGQRTGWGDAASYQREDVIFSGDITNAPEGAMEFMTVSRPTSFGLFVNIYSGALGSQCKLIIGTKNKKKKHWIEDIYISEKTQLDSRGNILGFLNTQNEFIVYKGRLGGANTSSPRNKAIIDKALVSLWTLDRLFTAIGIEFNSGAPPTLDLSYEGLSFDRLAQMVSIE